MFVLDRSVAVASRASAGVVVVVPGSDVDSESAVFRHVVAGGASRSESVRAGLAAVPADATVVCVHDAARPFASAELYARVVAAVAAGADGAIPGLAALIASTSATCSSRCDCQSLLPHIASTGTCSASSGPATGHACTSRQ